MKMTNDCGRRKYASPRTEKLDVSCEVGITTTSNAAVTTTVTTIGQKVESLDFTDADQFNTTWE